MNQVFIGCVLLCVTSVAYCDEPLTQYEQAAKNFSFENIRLGTALKDFIKANPNIKNLTEQDDRKLGLTILSATTPYGAYAGFRFLDDKLYEIRVLYDEKCLDKMGGMSPLVKKIAGILGKSTREKIEMGKTDKFVWDFPKVNRFFAFVQDDADVDSVKFYILDCKMADVYKSRVEKNAKTGLNGK